MSENSNERNQLFSRYDDLEFEIMRAREKYNQEKGPEHDEDELDDEEAYEDEGGHKTFFLPDEEEIIRREEDDDDTGLNREYF